MIFPNNLGRRAKMVKEEIKHNKKHFICEECTLVYKEKRWAEKCQTWCKRHNSCNINIIQHSVQK